MNKPFVFVLSNGVPVQEMLSKSNIDSKFINQKYVFELMNAKSTISFQTKEKV
jgi:hypothetical protein